MTHLEPYMDEFVASHLSRLMTAQEFQELLTVAEGPISYPTYPTRGWRSPTRLKALALASGLDEREYIYRHTLLPLVSFHNRALRADASDHDRKASIGWKTHFCRTARSQAFFCQRCVSDDQKRYGGSYWHLSHQIPGTFGCPLHIDQPLNTASLDAFEEQPSPELDSAELCSTASMRHPTIGQHRATCIAMFALRGPVSTLGMRTALIRRGRSAGLRIGKGGGRLLLSDVAVDLLPTEFLQDLFGEGGRWAKTRGTPYHPVDAVLCPGVTCSVASVVLAMTLLYDCVAEAFGDCFGVTTG